MVDQGPVSIVGFSKTPEEPAADEEAAGPQRQWVSQGYWMACCVTAVGIGLPWGMLTGGSLLGWPVSMLRLALHLVLAVAAVLNTVTAVRERPAYVLPGREGLFTVLLIIGAAAAFGFGLAAAGAIAVLTRDYYLARQFVSNQLAPFVSDQLLPFLSSL